MARFTLEHWRDEDWYVGRLLEVPGVFSQAATLDELEQNIRDAYVLQMSDSEPAVLGTASEIKEIVIAL